MNKKKNKKSGRHIRYKGRKIRNNEKKGKIRRLGKKSEIHYNKSLIRLRCTSGASRSDPNYNTIRDYNTSIMQSSAGFSPELVRVVGANLSLSCMQLHTSLIPS